MTSPLVIQVHRDGYTHGIQVSIGDEAGGFRLCGPKFRGTSTLLYEHKLTQSDADEIRLFLDSAFPIQPANP